MSPKSQQILFCVLQFFDHMNVFMCYPSSTFITDASWYFGIEWKCEKVLWFALRKNKGILKVLQISQSELISFNGAFLLVWLYIVMPELSSVRATSPLYVNRVLNWPEIKDGKSVSLTPWLFTCSDVYPRCLHFRLTVLFSSKKAKERPLRNFESLSHYWIQNFKHEKSEILWNKWWI